MTRRACLAALCALAPALAACDSESPTAQVGGPVYDFRMVVEATAAGLLPGGTVQLFVRGTVVDSARLTLRGLATLAAGGYTIFAVDEAANSASTVATGVVPDSLGRVTTTVPGGPLATAHVLVAGFGSSDFAAASKPLFFRFRNATTGALTRTGALTLGEYDATAPRTFRTPIATRWGRGGLWIDMPQRGDIWLRGYVLHVPLAPDGFQWVAWTVSLAVDTVKAKARLGLLGDSLGNVIQDAETPPVGAISAEFPKLYYEGTKAGLGAPLETFTHILITLEPTGADPNRPSPAVVYRGAFPRQYLLCGADPVRLAAGCGPGA